MYPTKQVSTAFISTPEHLCALLEVSMEQRSRLHVHCCDRDTQLCSAKSRTAQAIHSSHKQPPLAMCMLMAPHFLPPAAVTSRVPVTQPSGIPPVCPCSGEQWCGTDPATPAGNEKHGCQQLLHKNGHACMWRKARHQWFYQGHQTSFGTHRPCHPHKAFPWTPFCSPLLGRPASLEGWDSSEPCNMCCSGLSWRSACHVSS